jgi:glycosyltransferase involved in cell wall biosynthesis
LSREKLSVILITYNEEKNIRDCLRSVSWAEEIVVVDSGSTDRTVELAGEFTDRIFSNPWPGHKEQKNFALLKASSNWVLSIDADERVTDELREFILKELLNPRFDGYRFPRKNYFLGTWLKHGGWYPDHVLRLFRRDAGSFGGINPHDRVVIQSGRVTTTPVPILHYTYGSLSQYIVKQDFYSSISAGEKHKAGGMSRSVRYVMPLKAVFKFIEVYMVKRGFLDGYPGLVAAVGAAFSAFFKYAKIWEMQRVENGKADDKD